MYNNHITNNQYSTNNKLLILLISVISFFYFVLGNSIIPVRFHFDSGTIQNGMLNPMSVSGSYRSTVHFFMHLGFNYSTPIIVMVLASWVVFIFLLFTMLKINKSQDFSTCQIYLILFFTLMYGFYFTNYSKDIIILIFLAIALNLPIIHRNILINIILAIFIYGYFFRDYWTLIGALSLIPLTIKNVKIKRDLGYIFIAIILFILYYHMTKHGFVTHIRINVNANRINNPNAKSMIHNLVNSTSLPNDFINYIYVLISLFIPIQGLPSINMIIYYLWIWGIIYYCRKYSHNIDLRIILILIIYINVQALFEPDFGSVFRHQLAWFPVLFYGIKYRKFTKDIEKNKSHKRVNK